MKVCSNYENKRSCRGRRVMQPESEFFTIRGKPTRTCRCCRKAQQRYAQRYARKRKQDIPERVKAWRDCPQPRNGAGRPVGYLDDQWAAQFCTRCPLAECIYNDQDREIPRQWCQLEFYRLVRQRTCTRTTNG